MGIYVGRGALPRQQVDPWANLRTVTPQPPQAPAAPQQRPPGLLSRLTTPDDAVMGLAMGLLNAGRWSTTPINMSQALAEGMQGFQQGKELKENRADRAETRAQKKRVLDMEQARIDAWQRVLNGGAGSPMADLSDAERAVFSAMGPEQGAQLLASRMLRSEGGAELINLETPEGQVVTLRRNDPQIDTLIKRGAREVGIGAGRDSAKEAQIARLQEIGFPREVAVGVADGALTISRDETGRVTVWDVLHNRPWQGVMEQGDAAPSGDGPVVQPSAPTGAPTPPVPPGGGRRVPGTGQVGIQTPLPPEATGGTSTLPPTFDLDSATGLPGVVSGAINKVTDFLTGQSYDPVSQETATAMNNLKARTLLTMQEPIAGRASNQVMDELAKFTVDPGTTTGSAKARDVYQQTATMLRTEIERIQKDILDQSGKYKPDEVQKALLNQNQLKALLADYDTALGSGAKRRPLSDFRK